jgi:hypothetical protein
MSDIVHVIRAQVGPTLAPTRAGQHWVDETAKLTWISVGTSTVADWVLMGEDHLVRASTNDTTAGFLSSKISAGTGISLTTLNPGANEIIQISAPGSTTDELVKISATDTTGGYLNTELTVSNGTNATNPLEKSITNPSADEKLNLQFDQTKLSITASQVSNFNEASQDSVGGILVDTATIDFTYNDAGNQITADLKNTTVTTGSYGSATQTPSYTVDATGRLTSASNVSIAVPSTAITDFTEAVQDAMGGTLVDSTSIDFQYNDIANTQTAVVLPGGVDHNALLNWVANKHIDHSTVSLVAGTGISATGLGDITASRTVNIANTSVTAASYGSATQVPAYTVNAQGQLTAASNTAIAIPSTAVTDFAEAVDDRVAALIVAGTGITATYNDPANTLTIASTNSGTVTSVATGTGLTGGPITSSGTISLANTAVTAGSYGSATQVPTYTVNAQGQLTAAANVAVAIPSTQITDFTEAVQDVMGGALTDSASVDFQYNDLLNTQLAIVLPGGVDHNALLNWVANKHVDHSTVSLIAGTGISATGLGDITASRTINIANTTVTLGSYGSAIAIPTFTVNAQGQLTAAATSTTLTPGAIGAQPADGDLTGLSALAGTGIVVRTAADTYTTRTISAGTGITVSSGDGVSGNPSIAITNVGTAGTYGSITQIPIFVTNAQGQVTSVTNTSIAIPSTQITDFTEAAQDAVGGILTDTTSIDFTYNDAGNTISAVVLPGGVDHNALLNWVANKHIDHSLVSISAGTGLTGGGDITATRTLSIANVGTAGTYGSSTQIPVITTNAQGQVTAVTNTSFSAGITLATGQVGFGSGSNQIIGDNGLFWDNTNKRLGVGTITPESQWHVVDDTGANMIFEQSNNNLGESAFFECRKSRGTTASHIAVVADDKLGGWGGLGWTGTQYLLSTYMNFFAEAAFTNTSAPGYFSVFTTPVGSTTPVERLRINSSGDAILAQGIRVGITTDTTNGNIRFDGTEFQGRQGGAWVPFHQVPTYLSGTSTLSTTSATFATLAGMTTTPAAGTYKLDFTCASSLNAIVTTGFFSVFVGGVEVAVTRRTTSGLLASASNTPVSISTVITVNGSQVVDIRYAENASGTLTVTNRELILTPTSR